VSITPFDEAMLRRALFHAARGAGRTTPNPMVGAVVVSAEGVVAGDGWHERAGEPHAEVNAIEEAGALARGGTIYVTLEPCCHVGRTGPCTKRIVDAGIARVVAAITDPDPRVSGQGFSELTSHGIVVDRGLFEREAARLNQAFITVKTQGRPLVMLKAAMSLDARVAAAPGERTAITSPAANRRTQVLRAAVDGLAVGSETLLVDDPLLTARECQRIRPLVRVIFDRRLRTPLSARVLSTLDQGPVLIVTAPVGAEMAERARALQGVGATLVKATSLVEGLRALVAWDVSTLLVEGGPALQTALVREGLADRVHMVVAPNVLGPGGIQWIGADALSPAALTPVLVEPRGPDIWIEADVHGDC
jgi:diaminohydroxyphosphoribosylaminopyrimidine deaminase/5-amino-6-(5-phosphoribosylamino)uracil reductase